MTKSKTRIVARLPKGAQLLATICERSNLNDATKDGDIQIIFPKSENFEHPIHGNMKFMSMKISLHPSINFDNNTIKFEVRYEDTNIIDSVQISRARFKSQYIPVFAIRYCSLNEYSDIISNDNDWTIGRYNPEQESILMSIFVSDPAEKDLNVPNSNYVSRSFKYWKIHILFRYMRLPAKLFPFTRVIFRGTSGIRENGEFMLVENLPKSNGGSFSEVSSLFEEDMRNITIATRSLLISLLNGSAQKGDLDLITHSQRRRFSRNGQMLKLYYPY